MAVKIDDLYRDVQRMRENANIPTSNLSGMTNTSSPAKPNNATTAPVANVPSKTPQDLLSALSADKSMVVPMYQSAMQSAADSTNPAAQNAYASYPRQTQQAASSPQQTDIPPVKTMEDFNTAGAYSAPKWTQDYLNNVDTSYFTNAINNYRDYAERNRATQMNEAQKAQDAALKQAYLQRVQNERAANDALTRSGIRGGVTESTMAKLANQYGQARSAANTDYSNSVNSINQAIDQNIFDYTNDMDARAQEYRQNMGMAQWNADIDNYTNQYNALRENDINDYNAYQDNRVRQEGYAREDRLRSEDNAREDALRQEDFAREDALRAEANAREDALRAEGYEREDAVREQEYAHENEVIQEQYKREDEERRRAETIEHWTNVASTKSEKAIKNAIKTITNKIKDINKKLKNKDLSKAQRQKLERQKQNLEWKQEGYSIALNNKK